MKRFNLALAAFGIIAAQNIFAAIPANTDPTLISVPQLPANYTIGITGLYLQPSFSNGDLDYASNNFGATPNFNSKLYSVGPSYSWGFGVNAGFTINNTGNDINLSYTYLDTEDKNHLTATTTNGITPVQFNSLNLTSFNSVEAKAAYNINQVDLTAGQFINVGCRLRVHPNVGLRYADLQRILDFHGAKVAVGSSDSFVVNYKDDSDFIGIGPIAGLDASYYLGRGIGVVVHADSAIMIGKITDDDTVNANYVSTPGATTINSGLSLNAGRTLRTVPAIDMKAGLDYSYLFNNPENTSLTMELGWQFSHYYNAIDRINANVTSADGSDIPTSLSSITGRKTSDLSLQGPYLNLALHV